MMDNLLRACFTPPQAADVADVPALSAEEAAAQASKACEARIVRAHAAHCAKRLAASACEVLDQLLGSKASAQPGSQEQHSRSRDARTQGLSNLEASPGLEAADEPLNTLGPAGSQAGSFDAGDESWLEEEAQLQSSQEHGRDQSLYAGDDGPQPTGNSRPVSVTGGMSEQQELLQHSLLDFDEDPEAALVAAQKPQASDSELQVHVRQENAHQQLPAYFGGADEGSMALEGLLEEGSGNPSEGTTMNSLEPDDAHAALAAAHHDEALPSFFQLDEGTGLIELEPEASQQLERLDERVPEQEPAVISQASSESEKGAGGNSARIESNLEQVPQLDQGSTEGPYSYGAVAAAAGQEAASQVSTLSGPFRPLTPAAAQEHRHPQLSSQGTHAEQTPEDQSAIDSLQRAVCSVGRAASLKTQLAARSAALKQAADSQQARRRAISRYEWMHEAVLGPAGVLGPPVKLTNQVHPRTFRSIRDAHCHVLSFPGEVAL